VLLAGGEIDPNGLIPAQTGTLDIYDPSTGTFKRGGSFPRDPNFPTEPRFIFAATLLENNQVLLLAQSAIRPTPQAPPAWAVFDSVSERFSSPVAITGSAFQGSTFDPPEDPSVYRLSNSELLLIPWQNTTVFIFK
jgi:hypothetical protein